jgi:hypothetical protein
MKTVSPADATPANKVWSDHTTRCLVIEHVDKASLFKLLTVDDAAFRMAVAELYRAVRSITKFREFLDKVSDSVSPRMRPTNTRARADV